MGSCYCVWTTFSDLWQFSSHQIKLFQVLHKSRTPYPHPSCRTQVLKARAEWLRATLEPSVSQTVRECPTYEPMGFYGTFFSSCSSTFRYLSKRLGTQICINQIPKLDCSVRFWTWPGTVLWSQETFPAVSFVETRTVPSKVWVLTNRQFFILKWLCQKNSKQAQALVLNNTTEFSKMPHRSFHLINC